MFSLPGCRWAHRSKKHAALSSALSSSRLGGDLEATRDACRAAARLVADTAAGTTSAASVLLVSALVTSAAPSLHAATSSSDAASSASTPSTATSSSSTTTALTTAPAARRTRWHSSAHVARARFHAPRLTPCIPSHFKGSDVFPLERIARSRGRASQPWVRAPPSSTSLSSMRATRAHATSTGEVAAYFSATATYWLRCSSAKAVSSACARRGCAGSAARARPLVVRRHCKGVPVPSPSLALKAPSVASRSRARSTECAGGGSSHGSATSSASLTQPQRAKESTMGARSASAISGGACSTKRSCSLSLHSRYAVPGATRPARPARCVAELFEIGRVTSAAMPVFAS